jgi:hypothetical protein
MQELYEQGRIVQSKPGGVPAYKRYLDEMPGVPLQDVWDDILPLGSQAAERLGYPTQKPLALLERIIQMSSHPGDIVLDSFCGCLCRVGGSFQVWRKPPELVERFVRPSLTPTPERAGRPSHGRKAA